MLASKFGDLMFNYLGTRRSIIPLSLILAKLAHCLGLKEPLTDVCPLSPPPSLLCARARGMELSMSLPPDWMVLALGRSLWVQEARVAEYDRWMATLRESQKGGQEAENGAGGEEETGPPGRLDEDE